MRISYFIMGFFIALIFIIILLTLSYIYLKKKREKQTRIKGYLDMIPDLTEIQKAQVRQIRERFLPTVEGIRKHLYAKREELAELLFTEPCDKEKITVISQEILHHQAILEHEVIEHILEEKELLTPVQRRKFYEIITKEFSSGGLGVHDVKGRRGKIKL